MRRQNLFSFEQQRIIYTKHLSGESQHALAKQFGVTQSVIFRLIKKQRLVDSEFSHPFDAASSFSAYSGNDQASFPPHVFQVSNGMHPGMHFPPVPLAQEGEATSEGPFKRPSGTATSVPAHVAHGHPQNVYPNGIQSNTHFVHLAQEGRVAVCARQRHSEGSGRLNCPAVPSHVMYNQTTYSSIWNPSSIQSGKHRAPGPLAGSADGSQKLEDFTFKGDQEMTRQASSKAIDPQFNGISSFLCRMMDTDAETLTSQQNHTLLQKPQIPCDDLSAALPAASRFTMDEALSQRVELRAADRQAFETILGKLGTEMIDSIEYCRLLEVQSD